MDLSNCKTINDRAAAYAGEIIRLERINADLLAALECAAEWAQQYESETMDDWTQTVLTAARAAIRKAKGE